MNLKERILLDKIRDYSLLLDDIRDMKERIKRIEYGITASYGFSGGGTSYGKSKVESLSVRKADMEKEIAIREKDLNDIDKAIEHAGLSPREKDLIVCTKNGYSLSSYARKENIYKSHVYKIRDKAIRKMSIYIENET